MTKEYIKYDYTCKKCSFHRGIFDSPNESCICPDCKTSYTVTPIEKLSIDVDEPTPLKYGDLY